MSSTKINQLILAFVVLVTLMTKNTFWGYTVNAEEFVDRDGDTVIDSLDNCPDVYNKDQIDSDKDGIGDACDETPLPDEDQDGVPDEIDNCIKIFNPDQEDSNNDGMGDACSEKIDDADGDGIPDRIDNCPYVYNPAQVDLNNNFIGDVCEFVEQDSDKNEEELEFVIKPNAKLIKSTVVITWHTNLPSKSAIRYGYQKNNLNEYESFLTEESSHEVVLELKKDEKLLFFNVISMTEKDIIESDLIELDIFFDEQRLIADNNATSQQDGVVLDSVFSNQAIDNIERSFVLEADIDQSNPDYYLESIKNKVSVKYELIQKKLLTSLIIIISSILSVFVITDFSDIPTLFKKKNISKKKKVL